MYGTNTLRVLRFYDLIKENTKIFLTVFNFFFLLIIRVFVPSIVEDSNGTEGFNSLK